MRIDLFKPDLNPDDIQAVEDVLRSRWITTGSVVAEFEEKLKEICKADHAVATASCTSALEACLRAYGIGPGKEVITSPFTCIATQIAIERAGAKPVFADIDPKTYCIDTTEIIKKIRDQTAAIIPVHYGGEACNMDLIMEIADHHNLKVIEDAAHAIGGSYNGKPVGSHGHATCFSFHAAKNITTGEGGAVTTNDPDLARKLVEMRTLGFTTEAWTRSKTSMPWDYDVQSLGMKCNLTDIQAAIGLSQLGRLEQMKERRWFLNMSYRQEIAFELKDKVYMQKITPGNAMHLFTVRIPGLDRNAVCGQMLKDGIQVGWHYPPVHRMSCNRNRFGPYPVTERIASEIVSLPLHVGMTYNDTKLVIASLKRALECSTAKAS